MSPQWANLAVLQITHDGDDHHHHHGDDHQGDHQGDPVSNFSTAFKGAPPARRA
jgi:hypothetical protein